MYQYGVIGNCQINALVDFSGSINWLCIPRPDSPPIFGKLLDADGGHFSINSPDGQTGQTQYIPNTNILETIITQKDGAQFKIVDFCPRYEQFGRIFRPPMVVRIVRPLSGVPRVKVDCKPVQGWSKTPLKIVHGNSHVRFKGLDDSGNELRLTTNMPLTHLNQDTSFVLTEPLYFCLAWGSPFHDDLSSTLDKMFYETQDYWRTWVKHCSIPTLFQEQVIRSSLVLKLHCYEDTGAILASLTTSLPEEVGGVRNWDYRLCWLRDAYFSLTAFQNLGHFEEMEGFLKFLLNVGSHSQEGDLPPVFRLDATLPVPEESHPHWEGFKKSQPVRSGNQAAEHVQNDVYGEMILSFGPLFFDSRFKHLRSDGHRGLLAKLANKCESTLNVPDAGLWEFRNGWKVHAFSNLMCWAGMERMERLVKQGACQYDVEKIIRTKQAAEKMIKTAVVDEALRNSVDDSSFDASLSLLPVLRYSDKELSKKTVYKLYETLALAEENKTPGFFYRYVKDDDFGKPKSAFLACSFWMALAFASLGELKQAQAILQRTLEAENQLNLYSEHYDPFTKTQLGNFPQAYSHVGLINCAFAVSPSWQEVL